MYVLKLVAAFLALFLGIEGIKLNKGFKRSLVNEYFYHSDLNE